MDKKSNDISGFSMQQAMKFANSDAGKQLYNLLQSTQGDALQSAMDQAAAGNYDAVKKTMEQLLKNQEAKKLLQDLQG